MKKKIENLMNRIKILSLYIIFIFIFALTLTSYTLSNFSEENNMKEYYTEVLLKDHNVHEISRDLFEEHENECLKGAIEQTLNFTDGPKNINCEIILTSTKENYGNKIIENVLFKESYEKTYPCTFLQCISHKNTMDIIFTKQGHFYLNNIKLFLILGTIICGLLLLISYENVRMAMKTFGSLFFLIGTSFFTNKFLYLENSNFSKTMYALTNPISTLLLVLFIIGLILFISSFFVKKDETWSTLLEKIIEK